MLWSPARARSTAHQLAPSALTSVQCPSRESGFVIGRLAERLELGGMAMSGIHPDLPVRGLALNFCFGATPKPGRTTPMGAMPTCYYTAQPCREAIVRFEASAAAKPTFVAGDGRPISDVQSVRLLAPRLSTSDRGWPIGECWFGASRMSKRMFATGFAAI